MKFYPESCPYSKLAVMKITHRNGSLNLIIIKLRLLMDSCYRLKRIHGKSSLNVLPRTYCSLFYFAQVSLSVISNTKQTALHPTLYWTTSGKEQTNMKDISLLLTSKGINQSWEQPSLLPELNWYLMARTVLCEHRNRWTPRTVEQCGSKETCMNPVSESHSRRDWDQYL